MAKCGECKKWEITGIDKTKKGLIELHCDIDNVSLATIKNQGNNECEVQANQDFRMGDFVLKATLIDDEDIFEEMSIKVVGL